MCIKHTKGKENDNYRFFTCTLNTFITILIEFGRGITGPRTCCALESSMFFLYFGNEYNL